MEAPAGVNKSELVDYRDGIEADHPFIYSTWLKGLRHANDYFELIDGEIYFKQQHSLVERILADFEVTVRVACLREDPAVILAYAVYKNDTLHWVFCKRPWRAIGLAKDLIPKDIVAVSHFTKLGRSWLRNHTNVKFNPYVY